MIKYHARSPLLLVFFTNVNKELEKITGPPSKKTFSKNKYVTWENCLNLPEIGAETST